MLESDCGFLTMDSYQWMSAGSRPAMRDAGIQRQ